MAIHVATPTQKHKRVALVTHDDPWPTVTWPPR